MNVKRLLLLALVAIGVVGSFFLPNLVAGITDSATFNNVAIIDAQRVSFSTDPEFSLRERLALAANSKTDILELTTGQSMSADAAEARAIRELVRFLRGSPYGFAADDCHAESGFAAFVVDSNNPSANMIIWEFSLVDRYSNEMVITIDDETGIIMKLIYRQGRATTLLGNPASAEGLSEEEFYNTASRICDMMTSYYGISVVFGDYRLGNSLAYYRADLYGEEVAVPMFGVVRSMSFTMNERP
ncbi:MAG: hypothetical protein FWH33_08790 [Oscillospiraceae bacterium]|nr:hypothetical protein [Oscillospiraceae bacterium]